MTIRGQETNRVQRSALRAAILIIFAVAGIAVSSVQTAAQDSQRMEVGGEFSFVHTNAPPGKCGCFQAFGGAGWFAYSLSSHLALAGEVGSVHAFNINGTSADLTVTSFIAGPRYSLRRREIFVPFGQLLLGSARATGALTPNSSGSPGSANAFAMAFGGGLDIEAWRHWSIRAFQLEYYLTRFDNGSNDHQNNLRVGTGVAFHFGGMR